MDAAERLRDQLDVEIDDALTTAALVAGDPELADRAFGQLVDLLVERAFTGLRADYLAGAVDVATYRGQVRSLTVSCRDAGLIRSW